MRSDHCIRGPPRSGGNSPVLPDTSHQLQGWGVPLWTLHPWLSLPPCMEAHLFWAPLWAFRYLRHTDRSPLHTSAGGWLSGLNMNAWEV